MLTAQERQRAKDEAFTKRMQERCWFTFADGRRCTSARGDYHPSLCPFHADREVRDNNDVQFGGELIGPNDVLDNARAVNLFLTRVVRFAATRRITPKHAAIMGFLGQLLLTSLVQLRKEQEISNEAEQDDSGLSPLDMGMLQNLREQIEKMPDKPDPRTFPSRITTHGKPPMTPEEVAAEKSGANRA